MKKATVTTTDMAILRPMFMSSPDMIDLDHRGS